MSVFGSLFSQEEQSSREVAKNRLQLVLVHDRVNLSPGTVQKMKDELVDVISKYVEIDVEGMDVQLAQSGRQSRLTANIPVLGGRRRR